MATKTYLDQAGLIKVLGLIKETYVEKETGKSLISDELITKLQGIAAGAQVNVIESVSVNGVELEITDKGVNVIVPTKVSELANDSGYLTTVTEDNLAAELLEKVNASAEGNHSHSNKDELDLIASGDKAKWDQAVTDLATVKGDYLKAADKTELQGNIDTLAGRVTTNEGAISTLNGNSSVEGSVDYKIAAEFNKFMASMTDDGTVNTYKELIDYAATHGEEFTELVGTVTNNTNAIATLNGDASTAGSVAKKIADAIAAENLAQYAKAADLTAETNRATAAEEANAAAAAAAKSAADAAQAAADAAQADVDAIAADYVKASELVALTDAEIDAIWAQA